DSGASFSLDATTVSGTGPATGACSGLLSLASNGGPTNTAALASTSPAIGAGNPTTCGSCTANTAKNAFPTIQDARGSTHRRPDQHPHRVTSPLRCPG